MCFCAQGITQVIDAAAGRVQNIADFTLAGIDGFLNVEGTVQPVVPDRGEGEAVRVDVMFTAFVLKIGVLPGLRIPLSWLSPKVSEALGLQCMKLYTNLLCCDVMTAGAGFIWWMPKECFENSPTCIGHTQTRYDGSIGKRWASRKQE